MQNDNWGERARFGLFIVSSEAVPEAEWNAMAPPGVSIHAARATASTPWAAWNDDKSDVTLADDLNRGCRQFAAMRLQAVVIAHTSSSVVGGAGWDEATAAAMGGLLGDGVQILTNGQDTIAGLKAVGAKQPFLVVPPWFGDATVGDAEAYYGAAGLPPAGWLRYDPGPPWNAIPPGELYARGMGFAQEVAPLFDQIVAACPDVADAVFIAGTGFRCVAIIDALEQRLGRPVVTANQASLWRCLRAAGVDDPVAGYGRLLTL